MDLQDLWPAPADWEEKDSKVRLPRLAQQLWELLPFDWEQGLELVWLEGRIRFLAFLARKKPQP